MATNGTQIVDEPRLAEEEFRTPNGDPHDNRKSLVSEGAGEVGPELALAPLVDKIAYGIARGLVVAMKELENHIASETRKVGDRVGSRLDSLQASFQDLTGAVAELREMNLGVQDQCRQLKSAASSLQEAEARQDNELASLRTETRELATSVSDRISAATTSLREADARQETELAALRTETTAFSTAVSERIDVLCKELGIQQEDMAAVKSALTDFSSRADALVERLDRQADAVRSMYSAYAQRETELEQLVDGLARLRAYPAPSPLNRL